MEKQGTGDRYSAEVRSRAVRLVLEHAGEYSSQWAAISSIAGKIGCTARFNNQLGASIEAIAASEIAFQTFANRPMASCVCTHSAHDPTYPTENTEESLPSFTGTV